MKQYQETESGSYIIDGMSIPKSNGNRHYRQIMSEVESGEAQILPYSESPLTIEERRNSLQSNRDIALDSIVHNLSGARVMQVRPGDISNIQLAIQRGQNREWVMSDNSVQMVTIAELQAALGSGIAQAEIIWNDYMSAIKVL